MRNVGKFCDCKPPIPQGYWSILKQAFMCPECGGYKR